VRLMKEYAFDLHELKQHIDADTVYVLTQVFSGLPAVQKVSVICTSRITLDRRGLNPKMDEAFRIEITRDQHAKAKYGRFDSLKELGAVYHERLAALQPVQAPAKSSPDSFD